MQELFIGEAIRRRREALGLSQEELCEGICEPLTISRLENGKNMPSYSCIRALLQRLGMPDKRYYALLSKHDREIRDVRKELLSCSSRFMRALADRKKQVWALAMEQLHRLEGLADEDDNITRQFILSQRAVLGTETGPYSPAERQNLLLRALRLTTPQFDLKNIGAHRYTVDETRLISQIALVYSDTGEHETAVAIYHQLYEYVHKNDDRLSNYAPHFTLIAYNYARELALCRYYHDAIKIAEEGQRVGIDYAYYDFLGRTLVVLGECYYQVGEMEQSRNLYLQAHFFCEVLKDERSLKIIDPDIRERFGIEFPM